ncbi:hypothetical protein EIP86_009191 [Pleurotus ostreatoroseus]|nr:hypothetical protein EIP86_009191 [Pleurotus ostreatoroseus]
MSVISRESSLIHSDDHSMSSDLEMELASSPVRASKPTSPFENREEVTSWATNIAEVARNDSDMPIPAQSSPYSPNNPPSPKPPPPPMTPRERFRSSVRKIIAMRRGSNAFLPHPRIGAEPGIDPRRDSAFLAYGHIRQSCQIEVVDYSSMRSSVVRMTNKQFTQFIRDDPSATKEPWVKVRWINVGGVSWDVVSALALNDTGPQDILSESISKLARALPTGPLFAEPDEMDSSSQDDDAPDDEVWETTGPSTPQSTARFSTLQNTRKRRRPGGDLESTLPNLAYQAPSPRSYSLSRKDARNVRVIEELKRGERVSVRIAPMCIFLFRDGTVITIHHDTSLSLTAPISERLRQRDTGLRTTSDASMLVQSLLDLVVDEAMEVIQEYQSRILKLEQDVLIKPHMKHVRRLHILQGDLILHKRTLNPIKSVIYGLRRYDNDRAAALQESISASEKVQGFMSHKSKIYLADVHDHMEYILSSLDMYDSMSSNLIDYTFNVSVSPPFSLAPLTVFTDEFVSNERGDAKINPNHNHLPATNPTNRLFRDELRAFWIIALPVMAIVLPIFLWSDIERMAHYVQKRMIKEKFKDS